MPPRAADKPVNRSQGYDYALRRKSRRQGRQKGCTVDIPAAELVAAGIDPDGPPPYYRVWGSPRGSILVRLYREP